MFDMKTILDLIKSSSFNPDLLKREIDSKIEELNIFIESGDPRYKNNYFEILKFLTYAQVYLNEQEKSLGFINLARVATAIFHDRVKTGS